MTPLSDDGTRWTTTDIADPLAALETDAGATGAVLVDDGHIVTAGGSEQALPDAVDPPTGDYGEWVDRAFDDGGPAHVPATADGPRTALLSACEGEYQYRYVGVEPGPAADWLALFVDVTATVERYERLALFRSLVERAQDGLYATDGTGRISYCNQSFAASLSTDPDSLRGRPVADLAVEADRETYETAIEQLRTGTRDRAEVEIAHRTGDGAVDLSVHLARRDDDDPAAGVVAVARDVTERTARERRLEQYRTLVESADDPMWVLDAEGRVELCNGALAARLGTDPGALVGDHVTDVLPAGAADAVAAALDSLGPASDERFVDLTVQLRDDTGERTFDGTVGAIVDDDEVVGSVATFRDVTDRERRTADLTLLKRLLGTALRSDVQTAMDAVRSDAGAIAADAAETEAELARVIRETADDLSRLAGKCETIEELVDTDPTPETRDLSRLVDDALDGLREHTPDATLSVSVPSVTVLAVDALVVSISNLVENALEHAGPAPTVRIDATVEDTAVTLTIADDGPGIEQSELDALERGTETDLAHLSGVGLWLADWVVEKSGGDLDFEATIEGTTARVRLDRPIEPSDGVAADAQSGGSPADPTSGGSPTDERSDTAARSDRSVEDRGVSDPLAVLCLDSDGRMSRAIRAAADGELTVRSVDDVASATAVLADEPFDCHVSERLTGAAFDRLRTAAPEIPIVLYTDADHTDLDEAILTGVDSIVERGPEDENAPFLLQKVRAIAGSGGGAPPGPFDDSTGHPPVEDDASVASIRLVRDGSVVWETTDGHSEGVFDGPTGDTPAGPADRIERQSVDGETRYRRRTVIPLDDDLQVLVGTDVTRTVRRYRRLALYERLLNRAQDGISVVDANGEIRYHNPSFGSLLGYEDMVGTHTSEYLAEGELQKGQHAVQRLLSTPELDSEVLDMDFVTADGEQVTLAVHYTARVVDGEYAGLINVARDVTARKARERRLRQYRTLVETAPDPMFVLDTDGRVELCNEAASDFVGRAAGRLRGERLEAVVQSPAFRDEYRSAMESVREGTATEASFEVWLRSATGERRNYAVRISPLDGAQATGSVVTVRDVTDRVRRETELDRLQTVFARVLRHNLRNGLNVVMSNARAITERTTGTTAERATTVRQRCEELLVTCGHARAVIRAIENRDAVVTQRVATIFETVEPERVEAVDLALSPSIPSELTVRTHPVIEIGLEAIVTALARVAADGQVRVDATPAGETVEVTLAVSGEPTGAILALEGSPDEIIEGGAGVGLWLAAWLVEQSDGAIQVDGTDAETTVRITLPVVAPAD